MRILFLVLLLLSSFLGFSQEPKADKPKKSLLQTEEEKAKELAKKAPITSYRIITIEKDTTYVDTSLTIKDEYEYNYLRKDIFGLLPFANEGHTYTTLDFGLNKSSALPEFGFKAKHFNFQDKNQINYYSVATPLTELYFKTVMEQGQSLDALITVNTSERFNISLSFKGLRSKGKYVNQLTSNGNFRLTSSYNTLNKRYFAKFHFTGQDLLAGENGGVIDTENFESKDKDFRDRLRLSVYLSDASSFLKGRRLFLDHSFRINSTDNQNNLYLTHQATLENKFYEFYQAIVPTTFNNKAFNRFGQSYNSKINDQTKYKAGYNKLGIQYENKTLGKFNFFIDDLNYNYYYGKVIITSTGAIPSRIKQHLTSIGGQYDYSKDKIKGNLLVSKAISTLTFSTIEANLRYEINPKNQVSFEYQNLSKLPDNNYILHQSSYATYNWFNNFKNEKINSATINAKTQWIDAQVQLSSLKDYLYFKDNSLYDSIQSLAPAQYDKTINYISFKANKEIKYWKLALDNTILYQKTTQDDPILNVPEIVTRNTLYFSNYFYKKALYLQAGVTFNYFTSYYANAYNPVLSEFFVQNSKKIGDFSNFDFFINGRIRQTRIFVKAEHFNSAFASKNNFYAAPDYPYRDFIVRFGLVWNFFQ